MKANNEEKIVELAEKLKKHEINWYEYQNDLNKIIDGDKDEKQPGNSAVNYSTNNLLLHNEEEPVKLSESEKGDNKKNKYTQEDHVNKELISKNIDYISPNSQIFVKNKSPIIKVRNLTKSRANKRQLDDVSFDIFPGEFHIFIGNNGSGKTTVIKSIIGAYSKYKYKGTIRIKGLNNDDIDAKKCFSYIPENAIFPKKITLNDYLILFANLSNIPEKEIEYRISGIMKELGLEELRYKKPYNFSSGQKKKVLLAQGMINDPEIIILDEPVANLDPFTRMEIFHYLVSQKNKGKTIFLASHIFDEISDYVTYCTILDQNKIVFDNFYDANQVSLRELYEKYILNKTN